jgi:membrane-associated phospholipid phosphatase
MRVVLIAILLIASTRDAVADDPRRDRDRLLHTIPFVVGGSVYLLLELGIKDAITPDHCRWCKSNPLDTAARNRLLWTDAHDGDKFSNYTGYLGNPTVAIGLLLVSSANDPNIRTMFDDVVPVLQAGIVTGLLNQALKVLTVRRRPFAEFGGTVTRAPNDVNTSFFSGHSALAFAMTTSSATVAHLRGYKTEPALWIGGLTLATLTGYYRIAADAHYLTDVVAGGLVGAAVGVAIPVLFHRGVLEHRHDTVEGRRGEMMLTLGSGSF